MHDNTRVRYILLLSILITIALISYSFLRNNPFFSVQQSDRSSSTALHQQDLVVGRYNNQQLGLSFALPNGYRLATDTMKYVNAELGCSLANWSPSTAQAVVLTVSSPTQEQQFLVAAEGPAHNTSTLNPAGALPHSIYIAPVALTIEQIEDTLTALQTHHADLVSLSPIRHEIIAGAVAIQYSVANATDGNKYEVVYISLPSTIRLCAGTDAKTLVVMPNMNPDVTDDSALSSTISSLGFN